MREEINEEEAAVIRHCKDLLLKDGKSMQQVHRWVVGAGHLTVKGNVFTRVRLQKKILSSARIAGLREHLGEVTSEAVWPKIIEPEEHQQLRSLLAMKPAAPSSGGRRKYWASGFVFCSDCVVRGIPMSAYKKQERLRWRCDPNNGGCNGRFVGLEEVQAMIGMFVVSMLQNCDGAAAGGAGSGVGVTHCINHGSDHVPGRPGGGAGRHAGRRGRR